MKEQVALKVDIQNAINKASSVDNLRNIYVLYKDECDEVALKMACQEKKNQMGWA